jgi:hypothetical protein
MSAERRTLPRYLCTDEFSHVQMQFADAEFTLMSINFHRRGIALFTEKILPEITQAVISFSYQHSSEVIKIEQLPCLIKHRHETEVGHQYGIEFDTDQRTAPNFKARLKQIEKALAAAAHLNDRYGLDQP